MNNKPKSSVTFWVRGSILIAGLALTLAIGSVLVYSPAAHAQLAAWKVLPNPEAYTELYFNDHLALSNPPKGGVSSFTFTIHNVEGHTVTYPYLVISKNSDGKTTQLSDGHMTLANGASKSMYTTIPVPKTGLRSEISVVLPDQQQEIHFWLGGTQ